MEMCYQHKIIGLPIMNRGFSVLCLSILMVFHPKISFLTEILRLDIWLISKSIVCVTEHNLDFNSFHVTNSFRYHTEQFDRHMHLMMISSFEPSTTRGSTYILGGTLTAVNEIPIDKVEANKARNKSNYQ